MDGVQELQTGYAAKVAPQGDCIQAGAYLIELSLDWLILRASENIHHLLRESHVTIVDEPLGEFVHSQALHDLRNLFSRLSGTTGIARAYGIRLTEKPDLVDLAFHLSDGRILLEAVPATGSFGECFGTVGGLIAGLAGNRGQALLDNGARRMRALTGYDRVSVIFGDERTASSRAGFTTGGCENVDLPIILADTSAPPAALFPRDDGDTSADAALLRAPSQNTCEQLANAGIRAAMRVPFSVAGLEGEFRCESRTAREPCFEMHAAAELFAQLFAMQLQIDQLSSD